MQLSNSNKIAIIGVIFLILGIILYFVVPATAKIDEILIVSGAIIIGIFATKSAYDTF